MKNKVFYMNMLLMCIMTSCGDDNAPPIPAPTLSIDPLLRCTSQPQLLNRMKLMLRPTKTAGLQFPIKTGVK